MPLRRPLAARAASLGLALLACSDPTGPLDHVAGETYVLQAVDGRALPVVVSADGGWRSELVAETLEFRAFGRVRRTRTMRSVSPDGGSTTTVVARDTYYRPVAMSPISAPGAPLRVGSLFPCPPPVPDALSVACGPDEEGVAHEDALRLASIAVGPTSATPLTLEFRRASVRR